MTGEHIASAQHEFKAYLWYVGDLTPYWVLSGALQGQPFEASTEVAYDLPMPGGETEHWEFDVKFQTGTLAPRPDFGLDEDAAMREWRLKGRGPGQKKASFHIKPRWRGQRHTDGSKFKSPWTGLFRELPDHVDEGVDVTADGSNVEPDVFPHLLDEVCERLAVEGGNYWGQRFFAMRNVDRRSPITTSERYYRIEKGMAKKLVREDGYFGRLARLLTGGQSARAIWDIDNTECLGYRHTFRYNARTAREFLPGQERGKQLKCYYPKYVRTTESGDPLEHPKVGALFMKGRNAENTIKLNRSSVQWGDRDDLHGELENTLINVLEHAGVPTDAPTSFVADDHFSVDVTDRCVELHSDPTPAIKKRREASVAAAFREMTGAGQDVTQAMADGGDKMHVEDLANEADVSISTVYRVLERMEGVLENQNGVVRWACQQAAEEIRAIIDLVERTVGSATTRVARLLGVDERVFAKESGVLQQVAARYDLQFGETHDGRLQIRLGTPTSKLRSSSRLHRAKVVNEIADAWLQVGRALGEFLGADIVLENGETWRARSLIDEYRSRFESLDYEVGLDSGRERESALDCRQKVWHDLGEAGPPG
ncbi:hypothetical protein ACFQE8_07060 [Salinirubellus sp. GCM10025818]|uniref:DUF7845 domain-containing protein n=1 Tax=Salinirubellus TaxID=2162630 RepID=UPI0030D1311B